MMYIERHAERDREKRKSREINTKCYDLQWGQGLDVLFDAVMNPP
jgi:hypothetical protein